MGSLIDTGNLAVKEGRWQAAAEACQAALQGYHFAEVSLGHGVALWWLGDLRLGTAHLQKAYAAFRQRGDLAGAAPATSAPSGSALALT